MAPAQQRLDPGHRSAGVGLRLVVDFELAPLDGLANLRLEAEPAGRQLVHRAGVEAVVGLQRAPRLVSCHSGVPEQHLRVLAVRGVEGDAHPQGQRELLAAHAERRPEGRDQLARDGTASSGVRTSWSTTANSSCPSRPTVSPSLTQDDSLQATSFSSRRARTGARVSSAALIRRTSTQSTATRPRRQLARDTACSSRSTRSIRFGRSVTVSWVARCPRRVDSWSRATSTEARAAKTRTRPLSDAIEGLRS